MSNETSTQAESIQYVCPAGTQVQFTEADELREVVIGQRGTVVKSFAPNMGRNVQLADGRTVNVSLYMITEFIDEAEAPEVFAISHEQLLDLLTTAALVGRNEAGEALTRGDVTEILARRMRKQIAGLQAEAQPETVDVEPSEVPETTEARKYRLARGLDARSPEVARRRRLLTDALVKWLIARPEVQAGRWGRVEKAADLLAVALKQAAGGNVSSREALDLADRYIEAWRNAHADN